MHGIDVVEIERTGGISASRVREALDRGELDAVRELVPETTYEYICDKNIATNGSRAGV